MDFAFKRTNSFEHDEELNEVRNDNEVLTRISEMRKRKDLNSKVLKSMICNSTTNSLTGEEDIDVFLFENNKALREDLKEKCLISTQSTVHIEEVHDL